MRCDAVAAINLSKNSWRKGFYPVMPQFSKCQINIQSRMDVTQKKENDCVAICKNTSGVESVVAQWVGSNFSACNISTILR